jgi:dTDP-4-amino-4,6-dideoxygalactose transaminase
MDRFFGNESNYLTKALYLGEQYVRKFEEELIKYTGCKYAVLFNSGTATLHTALLAAGVEKNDAVITPALAPFMCTSSIFHAGAVPYYCDIDEKTFTMSYDHFIKLVESDKKKYDSKHHISAAILVSLYGNPVDLRIINYAKENDIAVILDDAQGFGGRICGKHSCIYGDITSYSFENSKLVNVSEGGAIVTDNEELATKCRLIGNHGFKNSTAIMGKTKLNKSVFQDPDYIRHSHIGYNFRMSNYLAAIGLAQMENVEKLLEYRRLSAEKLDDVAISSNCLTPQVISLTNTHANYIYACLYNPEVTGIPWKEFRELYIQNGGESLYSAWMNPYFEAAMVNEEYIRFNSEYITPGRGSCPTAERLQKNIMQFQTNATTQEEADVKARALYKTLCQVGAI